MAIALSDFDSKLIYLEKNIFLCFSSIYISMTFLSIFSDLMHNVLDGCRAETFQQLAELSCDRDIIKLGTAFLVHRGEEYIYARSICMVGLLLTSCNITQNKVCESVSNVQRPLSLFSSASACATEILQ